MQVETTPDTGAITGRILVVKPEGEIPVSNMILGLAEVIRDENGVAKVSGYVQGGPNRTTTDAYGRFILNGVKPGTYTLILDAVVMQYQLEDESSGDTILVDVTAGQETNVGTLRYNKLPVPGIG